MTDLNKFTVDHNIVVTHVAGKVGGSFRMSENKIYNGNSSNDYYGYADVLKKIEDACTYIWEIKPDKYKYYSPNGIGDRQLQRYLNASRIFEQEFPKPLKIGYNVGDFSIPTFNNQYINVRSIANYAANVGALHGLVVYERGNTAKYTLETEPVEVEMPSLEINFDYEYSINTDTLGVIIICGIVVLSGVACLITKGTAAPLIYKALAAVAA